MQRARVKNFHHHTRMEDLVILWALHITWIQPLILLMSRSVPWISHIPRNPFKLGRDHWWTPLLLVLLEESWSRQGRIRTSVRTRRKVICNISLFYTFKKSTVWGSTLQIRVLNLTIWEVKYLSFTFVSIIFGIMRISKVYYKC